MTKKTIYILILSLILIFTSCNMDSPEPKEITYQMVMNSSNKDSILNRITSINKSQIIKDSSGNYYVEDNGQIVIDKYYDLSDNEHTLVSIVEKQEELKTKGIILCNNTQSNNYNTYGYETSENRKSFIIDNKGSILIENYSLSVEENDVLYASGVGPVSINNGSIEQFSEQDGVISFTDIYGQNYFYGEDYDFNFIDYENNSVYFNRKSLYIPTKDGRVIQLDLGNENKGVYHYQPFCIAGANPEGGQPILANVYIIKDNFEREIVNNSVSCEVDYHILTDEWYEIYVDRIINGKLEIFTTTDLDPMDGYSSDYYKSKIMYENTSYWTKENGWEKCRLQTGIVIDGRTRLYFSTNEETSSVYVIYTSTEDGTKTDVYSTYNNIVGWETVFEEQEGNTYFIMEIPPSLSGWYNPWVEVPEYPELLNTNGVEKILESDSPITFSRDYNEYTGECELTIYSDNNVSYSLIKNSDLSYSLIKTSN